MRNFQLRKINNELALKKKNPETNPNPCETSDLILKLEKTILSRFDGLDKEISNIKDIVIKELQLENQRLRKKVIYRKRFILLKKISIH